LKGGEMVFLEDFDAIEAQQEPWCLPSSEGGVEVELEVDPDYLGPYGDEDDLPF
jgi:hypothetical protein